MADSPTSSFPGLRRSKSESAAPPQRSCRSPLSSLKPTVSGLALPLFSHSQTSIILRPFYLSDTPIIHQHLTDETIRLHVASPDVPTAPYELLDTHAWVLNAARRSRKLPNIASNHEATEDSSTRFHLAIARTEPDTAIGCISLDMYIGNGSRGEVCEIGYWLGKEWRGKGIMTSVVRRVVAWVFQEWSSVIRIDAGVYCSWNRASERVLAKSGFRCEGTQKSAVWQDGKGSDLSVWAIMRGEEEKAERDMVRPK